MNIGVSREKIENIKDEDKQRAFMLGEIIRIQPPTPPSIKPVLIGSEYDIPNMKNKMKFNYVKHIFNDSKKYEKSIVSTEICVVPLQKNEIQRQQNEKLFQSIQTEVGKLNLPDYSTREQIMDFACNNAKSNREKRRRATELQKKLLKHNYERHRITTSDISVY
tara:strand:- start:63 stop:554 length:492 start_codon:yes stop_codon:yes gene_type:complete